MDTELAINGNAEPPQGLNTHHPHEYQNGFGGHHVNHRLMQNGFHQQPKLNGISHNNNQVHQQDVLLSHEVSSNMLPIAGRKRCREEVDDEPDEWKRVRRLETGGGDCPNPGQGQSPITVYQPIKSHEASDVMMESGDAVEQPTFVTSAAPTLTAINNSMQGITNHQNAVPIVMTADNSLCSHQFYCSHKFKNSPCI